MYRNPVEGSLFMSKTQVSAQINKEMTNSNFRESVWVELDINKKDKLLIGGVYKSPNSSDENVLNLFQLLDSVGTVNFKKL